MLPPCHLVLATTLGPRHSVVAVTSPRLRTGCYPGSFDPPTVAHVAVAEAALATGRIDRVEFVLSRAALGKDPVSAARLADRVAALQHLSRSAGELSVTVTDARLVADIAQGYGAVVMGADKWRQVSDVAWYADGAERDAAIQRLPHALVAPRAEDDLHDLFGAAGVTVLDLDDAHRAVSSTAVRDGAASWRAGPA